MVKPISEAYIFGDACPKCEGMTRMETYLHFFRCSEHDLGRFDEPCTIEDWEKCPFRGDRQIR